MLGCSILVRVFCTVLSYCNYSRLSTGV